MRVLLVEDEPAAAFLVAKGLREQTYAVDVVGDGETALERVATNDYDAVILDVMLPGKDALPCVARFATPGEPYPS
jgi:DNA-binding response OmpR family regulator